MKIIQSKLLNQFEKLTQGFTTKQNGNIAFHVDDSKNRVIANHKKLSQMLSYNLQNLVHMKQIHTTKVHIVQDNDNFHSPPTCDALITNKKSTPLMVMVADCSPLMLYDTKQEVIAVVHAGRAGAFYNIVQKTLDSFVDNFNSNIEDIYVSIGASIGACCYEVGVEIKDEAKRLGLEYAISKRNSSFYLDISKILHKQLLKGGIKEAYLEISKTCTSCNTQDFFSYRAEGKTGRFSAILMMS